MHNQHTAFEQHTEILWQIKKLPTNIFCAAFWYVSEIWAYIVLLFKDIYRISSAASLIKPCMSVLNPSISYIKFHTRIISFYTFLINDSSGEKGSIYLPSSVLLTPMYYELTETSLSDFQMEGEPGVKNNLQQFCP